MVWLYLDRRGKEFGPFGTEKMSKWVRRGYFGSALDLRVRKASWRKHYPAGELFPGCNKDGLFRGPGREPKDEVRRSRPRRRHRRLRLRSRSEAARPAAAATVLALIESGELKTPAQKLRQEGLQPAKVQQSQRLPRSSTSRRLIHRRSEKQSAH